VPPKRKPIPYAQTQKVGTETQTMGFSLGLKLSVIHMNIYDDEKK
jgi:hypothetical protein